EDPPPEVPMADNRTMAEFLQAPTEGYEDAIVIPESAANNFKLKHGLINLVQNKQFFGHDKEDPHAHIRYFNKITSTMRVPYDSLNSAVGGNFLDKMPRECLKIIKTKSQVRQSRAKAVVSKVSTSSSTPAISSEVAELKDLVRSLFLDKKNQSSAPVSSSTPAPVKAVEPNCVTCGGPTIPTPSKQGTKVTKDQVKTPSSQSTALVQPLVIQPETPTSISEPVVAPTNRALIDVHKGELTLHIGNEAITYNLDQTSALKKFSVSPMLLRVAIPLLMMIQLFPQQGDILLLEAILNSKPLPPLPNHEHYLPSFKKELKVCEAKTVKSSVDEPPEDKLKDLPPHLKYVFLEGDNKLLVIISKELGDEEKFALIKVLKSHKRAISWKLSDIQGTLPSNTITNPKEELKGITTRSDVACQGPIIPTPSKQGTEPVVAPVSAPMPNVKSFIPYPSSRNNERRHDQANEQIKKFYEIFKDMSFEISFTDALIIMPNFASTLKALIGNKEKLSEMARTPMNGHCSAIILNKLPRKLGDPGKFLIPCEFPGMDECLAFADLSVSINLMPLSVWEGLSLPKLTPTCMTLELADRSVSKQIELTPTCMTLELTDHSVSKPIGISKDVKVKVDSLELDPSYYDPEGDIQMLKAILNSNPAPSLPNHEQSVPSFTNELKACEAKMFKSSVNEPPEVELKDLPPHLEYAFLEGDNKLPVIIAKELGEKEKAALIKVLKSHKRAIAWTS
nr:hypothetical protein [Tanacetum cinerariifolium]